MTDGVSARFLRCILAPLDDFSLRRRSSRWGFSVTVVLLSLAVLGWVRPDSTETKEGFECLARLPARLCEDPGFVRTRSRLELLSSECWRRRAEELSLCLTSGSMCSSGGCPKFGIWPTTSSSQCASSSSYIGSGAADVWVLGAFLSVRRLVFDILEPPSSVPTDEGGAEWVASSALLTREGRRRAGGAMPSSEVS